MGFTRIYKYKNAVIPYKHVRIKRDRNIYIKRLLDNNNVFHSDDELKFDEALSRAKRNIIDIVLCNDFEYFCTFTFNPSKVNRYSLEDCYKRIRKFFDNYKQKYAPDFLFIIVPEFHQDGAIHFHGCVKGFRPGDLIVPDTVLKKINDTYVSVPNTKKYLRWLSYDKNVGIFNCSRIECYNATAFYIVKYITKNMKQIPKGTHLYSCSRGLDRPELVLDEDNIGLMTVPVFQNEFVEVGYTRYDDYGFDSSAMPEWVCRLKGIIDTDEDDFDLIPFDYEQLEFC